MRPPATSIVSWLAGVVLAVAAFAEAPDATPPPAAKATAPGDAPAPAAAPAAPEDAIHVNTTSLATLAGSVAAVLLGGVIYAGKLLTTGYTKALKDQIDAMRQQVDMAIDQNKSVMAQNAEQMAEIVKLRQQLAGSTCPNLRPDGSCTLAAAATAPAALAAAAVKCAPDAPGR